jgi:hypothetical protein
MLTVAIQNNSTVVPDSQMPAVIAALQRQVSNEFAAAWNVDAKLILIARGEPMPAGAAQLLILDDSTQADALGFHETTSEGLPIGYCFAKSTMQDGGQWTVTASHELLELLADPDINLTVLVPQNRGGYLAAYEVCDAVEDVNYTIDGIAVSDFVLPSYFESQAIDGAAPKGPFDHVGKLAEPLPAMLPGGYLSVMRIATGAGWQQLTDARARHSRVVPPIGSRRHRRTIAREDWRRSER